MVTLGTGNMSPEEEETLGLVKEHDYAVLELREDSNNRLFLVKNPWCDSLVWTGVGSSATLSVHAAQSPYSGMSNTFWMTFEDVLQHFDSLYVNWNPGTFTYRQDHHFTWEIPERTEELVFTQNPQYSILSPSARPVVVLLNRHWQDDELSILRDRKAERDRSHSTLANVSKQLGFVALAMFANSPPGSRVPLSEGQRCVHQGPYVDSPNTLLRYEPTPGVAQTLVIAQGELPLPKYSFTLSFFSHDPLTIAPAADALPYNATVSGSWTRRTAGGSAAHASYLFNPQYALTLPRAASLALTLSTDVHDLPVHVAVIFSSGGRRVTEVAGRDMVCSSAEYQRGCTHTASAGPVDAGTYTVVVSAFEPGQTGNFCLRVCAGAGPIELRPVLADAAGRLRTAAPSPAVFEDGAERIRARLGAVRLTKLGAMVGPVSSPSSKFSSPSGGGGGGGGAPSAVRVALELGTGPRRKVLVVSKGGEFADASLGLRTSEVDVDPELIRSRGGLWLVVEQIGGSSGSTKGLQVEVLSDSPVSIGSWENGDD